jgi:hypothetical protein
VSAGRRSQPPALRTLVAGSLGFVLALAGCGGTLDAGRDAPHGPLPVDERNPVIIENDGWSDNWMGEYTLLLAANGGPPVVGIIASPTQYWPSASANADGWMNLVTAHGRAACATFRTSP